MGERKERLTLIGLGPRIPLVPVSDFTKQHLTREQWDNAWRLCGPSVERNMNGMRPLPLWKVIASAYLEGLHHGADAMLRQREKGSGDDG